MNNAINSHHTVSAQPKSIKQAQRRTQREKAQESHERGKGNKNTAKHLKTKALDSLQVTNKE